MRRVDTWRSPRRGRLAAQHSVVHAARPRAVRARAWARAKPQFAPSSQLQLGDPCQILIGPMTGKLGRYFLLILFIYCLLDAVIFFLICRYNMPLFF